MQHTAGVPNKARNTTRYPAPHISAIIQSFELAGARTHTPRQRQLPHGRVLPRAEELLALVVRPEAAHGVRHLAQPCPTDPVEQPARGTVRLLDALDHSLVARGPQLDLR